ncbi:hypothetical protein CFter6_2437 [Collimonas fungivorans]|uniref:Uncharacterized protein n=1 Tax=Collimonas fungivorans TaxID=158899 RepID=A0A127PB96_9BURK|nr:hypothetical protein CFter6_2437 [Collimonas fungivorans]
MAEMIGAQLREFVALPARILTRITFDKEFRCQFTPIQLP